MATIYVDSDIPASGPFAERRRREACRRALETCGWERLAPLAQHLAAKRLVRARGDVGASLRHLDVDTLREALSRVCAPHSGERTARGVVAPVINRALVDGIVTKLAGFVHLFRQARVYVRIGGCTERRRMRGRAVALCARLRLEAMTTPLTPQEALFMFRALRDPRIHAKVERLAPTNPHAALALRFARALDRESESRRVELPVVRVVREVLSRPGVLDDLRASRDDPIACDLLKVAEQLGIEG